MLQFLKKFDQNYFQIDEDGNTIFYPRGMPNSEGYLLDNLSLKSKIIKNFRYYKTLFFLNCILVPFISVNLFLYFSPGVKGYIGAFVTCFLCYACLECIWHSYSTNVTKGLKRIKCDNIK